MSVKVNLFVDGSWLFKACEPNGYLSSKTANPAMRFKLDFKKFVCSIQDHVSNIVEDTVTFETKYIASSIFNTESFPIPLNKWPQKYPGITEEMISDFIRNKRARTHFINSAVEYGGFTYDSSLEVLRPQILKQLSEGQYREKMVDGMITTKLLLCVAKHENNEYYAVATGDKDLLPTLQTEYPDFTQNVLLISATPDNAHGIASRDMVDFVTKNFRLNPFMLDKNITEILHIDK